MKVFNLRACRILAGTHFVNGFYWTVFLPLICIGLQAPKCYLKAEISFLTEVNKATMTFCFWFFFFLPFLVFYAQNAVSSRLTFLQQPRTRQPLSCNLNYCFKYSLNMTLPLLFAGWWGKLTFQSLWFPLFFFFFSPKKGFKGLPE